MLCYLQRTKHLGITFGGKTRVPSCSANPPLNTKAIIADGGLLLWSDASYGTARSHGGHVIMYHNGALAWSSRKLKVMAQSSTEAEICAGVAGCKDITFVRNIISFMWVKLTSSTALLIDNEGMWFNIRNSGVSQRTRHFELWMQYVREQYTIGRITAHHVGTNEERADIMTKAMTKDDGSFWMFRSEILNLQ